MLLKISHYHTEFAASPYLQRCHAYQIACARKYLSLFSRRSQLGPAARRRERVREQLEKKTSREPPPYTWTMGYNACVGRPTGGRPYPRFSGSSLNRQNNEQKKTDLQAATDYLIKVVRASAPKLTRLLAGPGQGYFCAFLIGEDPGAEARFRDWLSSLTGSEIPHGVVGLGLPIHMLSARSRGKIKDKATAFYRSCPGSRVFATLTFVAPVDDRTGVSVLNKFFTAIRKKHSSLQYFWVAERQPESRRIHFHVVLNKRLPVKEANALWVLQQYNAGLRGINKYGQLISMEEIRQRYAAGTVGKVLNPYDAKKIRSIGGLSGYLTKYITKQEKDVPFGCLPWHCSRGVSRLFIRTTVGPSAFRYCMSLANVRVDKKTGECWMPEYFPKPSAGNPFYLGVYINNKAAPLPYLKEMEQINKWMLGGLRPSRIPGCDDDQYRKHFLWEN